MRPLNLISVRPRSSILLVTFLAFGFAMLNFSGVLVENYNRQVEEVEYEKRIEADGGQRISFSACTFGAPTHYLTAKALNFFIFLFSTILLLKINVWRVGLSLFFQSLSLLHLCSWFLTSYAYYIRLTAKYSEKELAGEFSYLNFSFPYRYLEYSNALDFVVLSFLVILLFWQISILYCFVTGGFQARIYLR